MSERTLQLLQSLGYSAPPTTTASSNNIIDLRSSSSYTQETTSNESKDDDDDTANDDTLEFLTTLLAESQAAAVETFGAGSLCVGNVSDDPDIEDVAVVMENAGEGGSEEKDPWRVLVDKLGLDLSDFTDSTITPLNISATDSSSLPAPLIKGSKLYNLLASLQDLRRVTVSSSDDSVLLVAWLGRRKGILHALLGVTETT